jgi:hypothetical protein
MKRYNDNIQEAYNSMSTGDDDTRQARNYINDFYSTLDMKQDALFKLFKDMIYNLPKKYSNKKEILQYIRKNYPKANKKEIDAYIGGLDESRLEELVGLIFKVLRQWDGV